MTKYKFTRDYRSGFGTYDKGDEADFDDETAAWLNRDEPGCLALVGAEARAVDAPPADRMVHKATTRKDRGVESAMSTADSKLVPS